MNKKPLHVPDLAWSAAQALFEGWEDGAPMHRQCAEDLERVLSDHTLKGTFKRLSPNLRNEGQWVRLFECIANLRGALAEDPRGALKECDDRLVTISKLSRELSRQISRYLEVTEYHGISRYPALSSLECLVRDTYEREGSPNWLWINQTLTGRVRASYYRARAGAAYEEVPAILNAMAPDIDGPSHELEPLYRYAEIGRARTISDKVRFSIADAVRFLDACIEDELTPSAPLGFRVSDTDISNILTALLIPYLPPENPEVSREAVAYARTQRPKNVS